MVNIQVEFQYANKDSPTKYILGTRFKDGDYDKALNITNNRIEALIDRAGYNITALLCSDDYKDMEEVNKHLAEWKEEQWYA